MYATKKRGSLQQNIKTLKLRLAVHEQQKNSTALALRLSVI
jgi:hypothetical protein